MRPEIQRRASRRGSRTIAASSSPGSMPQRRLGRHEVLGWQNPRRRNWPGITNRHIVEGYPTCGRYWRNKPKICSWATSRYRSGTRRQELEPAYGTCSLTKHGSTERLHHLPHRTQAPVIPYHRSQTQMISVIDLTERKKAEEELSESEGRFRAVVEQATEGIVLFDVDSKRVLEANVACQNLLGYTL